MDHSTLVHDSVCVCDGSICSALCRILKLRWRSTLDGEGTYWDVAERRNKTRVTCWSALLCTSKVYFTYFTCLRVRLNWATCCRCIHCFGHSLAKETFLVGTSPEDCAKGRSNVDQKSCAMLLGLPCGFRMIFQPMLHGYKSKTWRFRRIACVCVCVCVLSHLGQNPVLHMAIAFLQVAGFWKWRSTSLHWSFRRICPAPQTTADWCSICSTPKGPKQNTTMARCVARWSLAVYEPGVSLNKYGQDWTSVKLYKWFVRRSNVPPVASLDKRLCLFERSVLRAILSTRQCIYKCVSTLHVLLHVWYSPSFMHLHNCRYKSVNYMCKIVKMKKLTYFRYYVLIGVRFEHVWTLNMAYYSRILSKFFLRLSGTVWAGSAWLP